MVPLGEPSLGALGPSQTHGFFVRYMATWTVRMLVEVEGSIETAR